MAGQLRVNRFVYLNRHLAENEYLMGKDFSVADVHLFVVSNWGRWIDFDLSSYSQVVSYRERIASRPAVQTAMKAEGLIHWPRSPP